jgi:hypothetical protein
MSDNSHYERLGVGEDASFDEIQEARSRLVQEFSSDRRQVEAIEAAYDAILMDRLRLRQEGKIKVPEGIRFPERSTDPPPNFAPVPPQSKTPGWLQNLVDTPSRSDILLPGGLFLGIGALSLLPGVDPALTLAVGVGFSLYFLNRKEHKFGRACLLTLLGLVGGILLGLQLSGWLVPFLSTISLSATTFAALVTFLVLWLISSFLR